MPTIIGAGDPTSGYEIDNSLRFGGDNHHLSLAFGSAAADANRRTWTFSGWIKLGRAEAYTQNYPNEKYLLTATDARTSTTAIHYGGYTSGNAGSFAVQDGRSGTYIETTSKFRDPTAWYHLVVKYDSTQSTASNRIFIYVNGVSQPLSYTNSGDPEVDLNTVTDWFGAGSNVDATAHGGSSGNFIHNVNSYFNGGYTTSNNEFDGYAADWYLLDGQALAPTEFGEVNDNGVWVPKEYKGTFNSHSFHLEFKQTGSSANSSGIGADTSGQDNHFKVGQDSTLDATNITVDTPTNNFCTLNPIGSIGTYEQQQTAGLAEGNLEIPRSRSGGESDGAATSTFAFPRNGKWYYEFKWASRNTNNSYSGLATHIDASTNVIYYSNNGYSYVNASGASYGDTYTVGDIIGVAVNKDDNQVTFYKNGSSQGTLTNSRLATYDFHVYMSDGGGSDGPNYQLNFGNPVHSISSGNSDANGYGNFEYAVPSGYYALCTKNIAEFG